jgi:hypothetical protein
MPDIRRTLHALIRGLVKNNFTDQQSAAFEIADYWSGPEGPGPRFDTSALCRKMSGSREWTISDVVALEALTGSTRVTDAMRSINCAASTADGAHLSAILHAQAVIKEGGEGANALLSLADGGDPDQAIAELMDIIEACQAAISDIQRESVR